MKRKIIPPIPQRENYGSYLRKRKGSNFHRIFGDTNTRWFYIVYNNEFFGYKNKESDKKIKGLHKFSEVTGIKELIDHGSKNYIKDWRYGLEIDLISKKYLLFAHTEETQRKWLYEFSIVLRLLPESFPSIEMRLFEFALDFYQKPFMEAMKKEMEEEEFKLKQEKKDKIKRLNEEKERRPKEEQQKYELERHKEEEEKIRIKNENRKKHLETILFNKKKKGKKIDEFQRKLSNIYDEGCESLIIEAQVKLVENNNYSITKNENNKNYLSGNSNIDYVSNFNFKENLNDWDFYDEDNEKISHHNLEKYNPIQRVINANKKPQVENMSFIKSCNINQKIQKEIVLDKKPKNKVFKNNNDCDSFILNASIVINNLENKNTIINNKTIENLPNSIPIRFKENKECIEKTIKLQENSGLESFTNSESNDDKNSKRNLILNNKRQNSMLDYDSKMNEDNIKLNLSINSSKKDITSIKQNNYNFQNSFNNSNSIINFNDNYQIPEIAMNQEVHHIDQEEPKPYQKKIKKPKNFKKITLYKSKDQGKNFLEDNKKEKSNTANSINLHEDHLSNSNHFLYQIKDINTSKVLIVKIIYVFDIICPPNITLIIIFSIIIIKEITLIITD